MIAAAVVAMLLLGSPGPDPVGVGSTAPGFTLAQIGARAPMVLHDLRGKVVLLNFWATWCKPCEDEMPAMERLYQELAGRDFELIAVSVDQDPSEVAAFAERLALTFPILLDPDHRVAQAYQTYRYPESFLIDPEGVVSGRFIGPRDWDSGLYARRIASLLGEAPAR